MEDQTRFDLNRALIAWKEELSAQPGISAEDTRELETHLLECFETGRRGGLNEQEAFESAVRQVGACDQIGAEFEKINPLRSWRPRVFLMAFAGLIIWAWSSASGILALAGQVFLHVGVPGSIALALTLNGVIPLAILILLAGGRAAGLPGGMAWLFRARWLVPVATIACGLVLNYALALTMWHHPNPENIFGPGGRELLSVSALFWQYCSRFPSWPGPLLILLIWLCRDGRQTLSGIANHSTARSLGRQAVFWIALGGILLSCFSWLGLAASMVWSRLASALFARSEGTYMVINSSGWWLPNIALLLLAAFTARGQLGSIAEWMSQRLNSRSRIAASGVLAVLISCGISVLWSSQSWTDRLLMLLYFGCWPVLLVGFIAWLAPSVRRKAAS